MLTAFVLALWAYICIYDFLGAHFWYGSRPLPAAFVTGLIIGDVQTGLMIGGTLELMGMGIYTYGGASIPDYLVGAILGTYFGKSVGFEGGLALAVPAALLLTQVDVFGRTLNFVYPHKADEYAEKGDTKGFDRMMYFFSPAIWGLSRAIPVFLAVAFGEPIVQLLIGFFEANPWFNKGMAVVSGILPALGFALLLRMLPVKKYAMFLLLGFILFAYLNVDMLGIALIGLVVVMIYQQLSPEGKKVAK